MGYRMLFLELNSRCHVLACVATWGLGTSLSEDRPLSQEKQMGNRYLHPWITESKKSSDACLVTCVPDKMVALSKAGVAS